MEWLQAETNVSLFLNYRAFSVKKEEDRIISITACHIESGEEIEFYGRLFADCTGDGTIGYLAGADYRMGRESRSEYGETIAPEIADSLVMGTSVQWYSVEDTKHPIFRNSGTASNSMRRPVNLSLMVNGLGKPE